MTYKKTVMFSILLSLFLSLILNISFAQLFNNQFDSELLEKKDEFGNELDFHTWGDTTGNVQLSIELIASDSELAREGQEAENNVLAVERTIASWGGFTNVFNDGENIVERDLSSFTGINFWFYGTNEGNEIFFELFDNRGDTTRDSAERFEFPFYNDFLGWEQITVPFEELKRRVDWQPGGEPNDGLTLNNSLGYAFRWGESSGTTYIDDVTVYKSESVDDGSLRASLSAANFELVEGESLELTLRLNREGEEASSLRYQFAVSDDETSARAYRDFVGKSELVVFPAGVTEKTIVISTLEDSLIEGSETYKITLAPAVGLKLGANKSATITILDNDAEDAHLIDDFSKAGNYLTSETLSSTTREINDRMKQARPEQATFENMLELSWSGAGSFEKPIEQDWQFVEQIAFWYLGTGSEQEVELELVSSDTPLILSFPDSTEWQYIEFSLEDLATVDALRFNLPNTEIDAKVYLDDIRIESRLSYKNPAYSAEERAADLLLQMSLEEKIGQMTQINSLRLVGSGDWDNGSLNDTTLEQIFGQSQVGSILSGGGASPPDNVPAAWATLANDIQDAGLSYSNLDIPVIYGIDAVHGHNNVAGATIYPHNIGLGATWNPELVKDINLHVAKDLAALGHHWNFSPVADIARDARWGRFYESYSEDPLLVSELVVASIDGLQDSGKVAATVKHFTGYGQPFTGFDRAPAHIDMRSLRSIHLPSYQAGIDAGALTMMVNSGSVNGIPVHASQYMLETLAREKMGFEGVFISDWEDIHKLVSVHGVAKDFKDAVAMSINAGVDMYMVPNDAKTYTTTLKELVDEGTVSMERIDTAVSRILALKVKLGLFENNKVNVDNAASIIEEDRQLAKQAALESITLLKNKSILPLNTEESSIFLVGPSSDNLANQMGGWTIGWQGMDNSGVLPPGLTIREALTETLGDKLSYTANYKNSDVVTEMASEADVSIVVVGEKPYAEGDGNDARIELAEAQLELIRTLAETDTRIVLVLVAGRPLIIPNDVLTSVDAFVMTFLGGSEAGTALADVLVGNYNPSGKLSFSWPKHVGQIPVTYDRLKGSPYDPLYDFGYGLSYTNFRKRNLSVSANETTVQFSVEVENTGKVAGSEVVQAYVKFPALGVITSEQKLIAFDKVWLEPGESHTVNFNVPIDRLAIIPQDIIGLAEAEVMSGEYSIMIDKLRKGLTIP